MRLFKLSFLLLFAALSFTDAWAFRCGSRIVDTGISKPKVRAMCGEPSNIETRSITQVEKCCTSEGGYYTDTLQEPVDIEEWTYNFGPHRLMLLLHFKNGSLKTIESLGYGYRE